MYGGGIQALEIVLLLLLAFVIGFAMLARKLRTPYPIILVIGGLLIGFVPGIPPFNLNPEVIFFIALPPCFTRQRGSPPGGTSRTIW